MVNDIEMLIKWLLQDSLITWNLVFETIYFFEGVTSLFSLGTLCIPTLSRHPPLVGGWITGGFGNKIAYIFMSLIMRLYRCSENLLLWVHHNIKGASLLKKPSRFQNVRIDRGWIKDWADKRGNVSKTKLPKISD